MSQQEKRKNIFQSAINAVSNRDEKAALEAAMKEVEEMEQRAHQAEQRVAQVSHKLSETEQREKQSAQKLAEAEKKITQLTADLSKAQTDLAAARVELGMTKNKVTVAEQKLAVTNAQLQKLVSAEQAEQIAAAAAAAEKSQFMAEHTLKADETLSHLSLKYYGSGYEPYWRVIYEANKELIGENPARVRPGMVIKIPVLPEELKKK
jgi:nucleoid-associated protein YgaU